MEQVYTCKACEYVTNGPCDVCEDCTTEKRLKILRDEYFNELEDHHLTEVMNSLEDRFYLSEELMCVLCFYSDAHNIRGM